jgi:hypothetical protein
MAKWNKQGHQPVADPQRAGGPSTTGKKSGDDRANVVQRPPLPSDGIQPRPKAPKKP